MCVDSSLCKLSDTNNLPTLRLHLICLLVDACDVKYVKLQRSRVYIRTYVQFNVFQVRLISCKVNERLYESFGMHVVQYIWLLFTLNVLVSDQKKKGKQFLFVDATLFVIKPSVIMSEVVGKSWESCIRLLVSWNNRVWLLPLWWIC